jgi:VanZ family protein
MVVLLAIIPLSDSLNLATQNSYLLERLRFDHLFHSLLFLPLFGLVFLNLRGNSVFKKVLWSLLISLLFAVFAEVLQIFVPYRAFTFPDLQANAVGVLFGAILFFILNHFVLLKKSFE